MNRYQLFSFSEINFALRRALIRLVSFSPVMSFRRPRTLAVLLSDPSFRLPILKITTSFPLPDGFPFASRLLDRFVRPYSTKYPATSRFQTSLAENQNIHRILNNFYDSVLREYAEHLSIKLLLLCENCRSRESKLVGCLIAQ